MKHIPLTQGFFATVDDCDFHYLSMYKWIAHVEKTRVYAWRYAGRKDGKAVYIKMHRQILGLTNPVVLCDHIDGNGLNNQRSNLRECNKSENGLNAQKRTTNTTGFKGVVVDKRRSKFKAQIKVNYKCIFLGYFECAIEAAKTYDIYAQMYFGKFAKLNFPT